MKSRISINLILVMAILLFFCKCEDFRINATALSTSLTHTLVINNGGLEILSAGQNSFGQLGDGFYNFKEYAGAVYRGKNFTESEQLLHQSRSAFIKADFSKYATTKLNLSFVAVSAGNEFSLVLDSSGITYSFGRTINGQLGFSSTKEFINTPTEINSATAENDIAGKKVVAISAGGNFAIVMLEDRTLYGFGKNSHGQLGHATWVDSAVPVKVKNDDYLAGKIISGFSAGWEHVLAYDTQGACYGWGNNEFGQLGDGTFVDKTAPLRITTPISVLNGKTIVAVSAGFDHSLVLDSNGIVYSFGNNSKGQLGSGDFVSRNLPSYVAMNSSDIGANNKIVGISAKYLFSLAVSADGKIYAWGSNEIQQIAVGSSSTRISLPMEVICTGDLRNKFVVSLSTGVSMHTAVRDINGEIYSFGLNSGGQLGIDVNVYSNKNIPWKLANPCKPGYTPIYGIYPDSSTSNYNFTCIPISCNGISTFANGSAPSEICNGAGVCVYQDYCDCQSMRGGMIRFGDNCQFSLPIIPVPIPIPLPVPVQENWLLIVIDQVCTVLSAIILALLISPTLICIIFAMIGVCFCCCVCGFAELVICSGLCVCYGWL